MIAIVIDAVKAAATVLALAFAVRCERASCHDGWYVNGVNSAGVYKCRPVLGDSDHDIDDARSRLAIPDDREEIGLLYCTGGSTPRQDGIKVWCERP